jgi:hypothetical protein
MGGVDGGGGGVSSVHFSLLTEADKEPWETADGTYTVIL